MNIDWTDFLQPLTTWTVVLALVNGLAMGAAAHLAGHQFTWTHVFWQLASGAIFFIPLAILRSAEGSEHFARLLSTYILWVIFVVGMWMVAQWPVDDSK